MRPAAAAAEHAQRQNRITTAAEQQLQEEVGTYRQEMHHLLQDSGTSCINT